MTDADMNFESITAGSNSQGSQSGGTQGSGSQGGSGGNARPTTTQGNQSQQTPNQPN